MIFYCQHISPRLRYIAGILGERIAGKQPVTVTDDPSLFCSASGIRINYSNDSFPIPCFQIIPQGLLSGSGIRPQAITMTRHKDYPAFFETGGDWPFDILAASFYLLTRYEEYLPHRKDVYGRYAHTESLAYREGFLSIPLVDHWIRLWKRELKTRFPEENLPEERFRFLPTYDVDEAWCYRHKTWQRSAGGALRDLLKGQWGDFFQRRRVLNLQESDPYDAFDWMNDLHRPWKLKPLYFFHVGERNGKYDKQILPAEPAMLSLIAQLAGKYAIGLHPSWQSGDDAALLSSEKATLARMAQQRVDKSRQHYIRFILPGGYRQLIQAGVTDDYSMGYGSINGFRASVSNAFYWYDLEEETETALRLHPFCYMEANSFYEQRMNAEQALEEMRHYLREVRLAGGTLISIWHNTILGTHARYTGWKEVYSRFFHEAASAAGQG